MTHYLVYQITNKLNGKFYIGCHKTKCVDDGYMGSGMAIKNAIRRHGLENFTKTILKEFKSSKAMYTHEAKLVTPELVKSPLCYNLRLGGDGGFEHINQNVSLRKEKNRKAWQTMRSRHPQQIQKWAAKGLKMALIGSQKANAQYLKDLAEWKASGCPKNSKFQPKKMTEEAKKKIAWASSDHNSQQGTCWIYDENLGNRKVKKDMLDDFLSNGWQKGRKMDLPKYCDVAHI